MQVFDINTYLQENRIIKDTDKNITTEKSYKEVANMVKEHFRNMFSEDKLSQKEIVLRQELEHKAILLDPEAEKVLISEIEDYLREHNLLGVSYPKYFKSLAHAIFHEIYIFGEFYKWESYPMSPSAVIQGKEIWFKIDGQFVKQPEEFESEEKVYEIIRALQVANRGLKINESNPQAEIEMKNRTRVTVSIPPRSYKPTIVFRRFTVKNFSFDDLALKYKTISHEDIEFFKTMAKLYLNTIIAGEVESGKSTFLKTIFGERDPNKVVVLIETSPESYLKEDFPDRLVHDFYTSDGNISKVIRLALRVDHDYVIVQEVRGIEAEGAISGTERGTRGLLMTYHITFPEKTPEQLAQHIVDEFPNRSIKNEVRRISKQLDIGITMKSIRGGKKKLTSLYEIVYDYTKDKSYINYLIYYNPKTNQWEYNGEVSDQLFNRMDEISTEKAKLFVEHLKRQAQKYPMSIEPMREIYF